jgi:multiple sugar transport system substrate-binding protein
MKKIFRMGNRRIGFFNMGLPAIVGFVISLILGGKFLILPALSQEPVTLTLLMTATEVQPWKEILVPEFEQKNPGIRINVIEGPNATDLNEDLYTSAFILGDSPYDLINMDVIWTPKFAAAGWLLPLEDRITDTQLKAFLDKDVEGGRYNGKLYRIPFRSDAGMLYYRTDLLKQAGYNPPETFEELVKISQELQGKTDVNWGYLWQGGQYEGLSAMFVEVLEGFGGYWVNPETKEVGLDQPAAIEAVEFLRNTIKIGISPPGVTTYKEEETRRIFQNGEAVFLRSWPYVWPLANQKTSAVNGKIGIKPMVHSPNSPSGACLGGWGLGISKSSKNPDAAWKAIQFFTSEEAQRKFILETGFVPSRRSLFTDSEIVSKYGHYPELLQVVEKAVLRPPIAQYAQTSDILQRYLSAAISGRMSSERAMKAAAAETRRLLETS